MSCASFSGKDLGQFMGFPYSCIFAHTINGNKSGAGDVENYINTMWEEYFKVMKEKGNKSSEDIAKIYRDHLIFKGVYMLAYYGLDLHMNFLPIDEANVEDRTKTKESIGMIGFKCFELGCNWKDEPNLALEELKARHKAWVDDEVAILLAAHKPARRGTRGRRSSMLRQTGRRVSDGHLHVQGLDRESFKELQNCFLELEGLADLDIHDE